MGFKWVVCTVYKLYLNRVAFKVKLNKLFSKESLPRAHATLGFRATPVPKEAVWYPAERPAGWCSKEGQQTVTLRQLWVGQDQQGEEPL